jgi:hypothetical protein
LEQQQSVLVPQEAAAQPDVAVRPRKAVPLVRQQLGAVEQPQLGTQRLRVAELPLQASLAEAQPSLGGSPQPEARWQVFPEHTSGVVLRVGALLAGKLLPCAE